LHAVFNPYVNNQRRGCAHVYAHSTIFACVESDEFTVINSRGTEDHLKHISEMSKRHGSFCWYYRCSRTSQLINIHISGYQDLMDLSIVID